MYRPRINKGNLVGQVQEKFNRENTRVGRDGAFNSGQVKVDESVNDGNYCCTSIHTTVEYTDMCNIQQQYL
jgi:hypothetical protein